MKKQKFASRASMPKPAPAPAAEAGAPVQAGGGTPGAASAQREMPTTPFAILAEYERLSLEHVAGLPAQMSAPGLWRGVGYRVGRQRLASGFEEVVEILPM